MENIGLVAGAVYGALQGVAQLVMLIAPQHTIAWRIAKYLVSGQARPQ